MESREPSVGRPIESRQNLTPPKVAQGQPGLDRIQYAQ